MSEWISVKDRLPDVYIDSDEQYLLCWENIRTHKKHLEVGHISEYTPRSFFEGVQSIGEKDFFKITHWFDLPEPPK